MNNEVTLEELNKPTDTELASLRCVGSAMNVALQLEDTMGTELASGVLTAERAGQWLKELRLGLPPYNKQSLLPTTIYVDRGGVWDTTYATVPESVAESLCRTLLANHLNPAPSIEEDHDEHMIRVRLDEGY